MIKKKYIKKNLFILIIFSFLISIFLQKTNFYSNIYQILSKSYEERFIKSYNKVFHSGFCEKESHGYIYYIKNNYLEFFPNKKVPKIINFEKRRVPYWIFLKSKHQINDEYQILLHLNLFKDFQLSKYKIIDNYQNKCLFVKKND